MKPYCGNGRSACWTCTPGPQSVVKPANGGVTPAVLLLTSCVSWSPLEKSPTGILLVFCTPELRFCAWFPRYPTLRMRSLASSCCTSSVHSFTIAGRPWSFPIYEPPTNLPLNMPGSRSGGGANVGNPLSRLKDGEKLSGLGSDGFAT